MGMPCLDACIYIIIAILSVAYPILLQVISRLDDKYSSARAVELFESEPERKLFVYCLIAAVVAVAIWFCHLPAPAWALDSSAWWAKAVVNSALLLVCMLTAGLLVFFFLLTDKTLTYYNTQKFSTYLQRQHLRHRDDYRHFEILADIFSASIAAKNSPVLWQIADFFSDQFTIERARAAGRPVVYPAPYYQLAYRATEELAVLGDRKHRALAHRAAGGGWLLGGHQHQVLSEETYTALWHTSRLALDYGQQDMVYDYWRTAHQYAEYCLRPLLPEYSPATTFPAQPSNQAALDFRRQERARFFEFHQALGALLLYTGRPELLHRLFDYTTSQPPRYELLPDRMADIFAAFVGYWAPFHRPLPIDASYPFPNEAGLASEGLITRWLGTYLAVLFLRLYTLGKYLVGDEPLAYPAPPDAQPAKQQWLNALTPFRHIVTQVLQDSRLLESLGLDYLTEAWCQQRHVAYPLDFLNTMEQQLTAAYQRDADELPLSEAKLAGFYTDSGSLLSQMAEELTQLAAPAGSRSFEEADYVRGRQTIIPKDYFLAQPTVPMIGLSTAFASLVRENTRCKVARLFNSKQTATYRVRQQELFAAIDKLNLDESHIIINLGVQLTYLANGHGASDFQAGSYKGATVLEFNVPGYSETLLVLKQAELPAMQWLPVKPADVAKYHLTEISQPFNLYAAILDANRLTAEVAAEVQEGDFGDFRDAEMKSQALQIIRFCLEIKWQRGAKLVRLISHDPYGPDQPLASLTDIPAF